MKFYKMINGENFVGIGTSLDMRCFQLKHRIILRCDESEAQYIQYKDELYRATWMLPVNNTANTYTIVEIIEIDEKEYSALKNAIESGEEVEVTSPQEEASTPVESEISPADKVTIEYVRNAKINAMSAECSKAVTNGFDVVLADGLVHHFDLTIEDQLNLISLKEMLSAGATEVPYHERGCLCKMYSVEDITVVIDKASTHKTYHLTYFNSLKNYIMNINEISEVDSIQYGIDIPAEYCSEILLSIAEQ